MKDFDRVPDLTVVGDLPANPTHEQRLRIRERLGGAYG